MDPNPETNPDRNPDILVYQHPDHGISRTHPTQKLCAKLHVNLEHYASLASEIREMYGSAASAAGDASALTDALYDAEPDAPMLTGAGTLAALAPAPAPASSVLSKLTPPARV